MAARHVGQALFVKELCDDDIPEYLSMLSQTVCTILGIKSHADEAWYLAQRLEKIKDGLTFSLSKSKFLCFSWARKRK